MQTFPTKLTFSVDKNEAKFISMVDDKKAKEKQAIYEYTKSKTKLGTKFTTTLDYLNRLLDAGYLIVD